MMKPTTELIIKQYQDSLFSWAFSICKNAADADDVVQDTFIKYHTKDIDFETPEHVKALLIRVCVNRSKDVVTSFWRRNKESLEDKKFFNIWIGPFVAKTADMSI